MNRIAALCTCFVIVAVAWWLPATRLAAEDAPPASGPVLHKVGENDTLRGLADRFLGDPDAVPELLALNNVSNPAEIMAGSLLVLPGPARTRTLKAIGGAERLLLAAAEKDAEELVPDAYRLCRDSLVTATRFLSEAQYEKAHGWALLAGEQAQMAGRAADQAAVVRLKARVIQVSGSVTVSTDDGATWKAVNKGDAIPVLARIKVADDAGALLELPREGTLQLMPGTDMIIADQREDSRTKRTRTLLQLRLGEILGKIRPRTKPVREFEIISGEASIAIRGTQLRTSLDPAGDTRVMTYEGSADVAQGGKEVAVMPGFGLWLKKGRPAEEPVPLLPAPDVEAVDDSAQRLALLQRSFSWSRVKEKAFLHYSLELSRDAEFVDLAAREDLTDLSWSTALLDNGEYFFRVATVNSDRLKGPWSDPITFAVKKSLGLKLSLSEKPRTIKGKPFVPKGTLVEIAPKKKDNSIDAIVLSLNDEPDTLLSEPLRLERDGAYSISARARGADGSLGKAVTTEVHVDGTPPTIRVVEDWGFKPMGQSFSHSYRFLARDALGVDYIEYSLDGGPFVRLTKPVTLAGGVRANISYRAVDLAGNVSATGSKTLQGKHGVMIR